MISLRRTALIWTTALFTLVSGLSFFASYEIAKFEAGEFLDGQLRLIAVNVGDGPVEADLSLAKQEKDDQFVITIWTHDGGLLRNSPKDVLLPRQLNPGYVTIRVNGEDW